MYCKCAMTQTAWTSQYFKDGVIIPEIRCRLRLESALSEIHFSVSFEVLRKCKIHSLKRKIRVFLSENMYSLMGEK